MTGRKLGSLRLIGKLVFGGADNWIRIISIDLKYWYPWSLFLWVHPQQRDASREQWVLTPPSDVVAYLQKLGGRRTCAERPDTRASVSPGLPATGSFAVLLCFGRPCLHNSLLAELQISFGSVGRKSVADRQVLCQWPTSAACQNCDCYRHLGTNLTMLQGRCISALLWRRSKILFFCNSFFWFSECLSKQSRKVLLLTVRLGSESNSSIVTVQVFCIHPTYLL